MNKLNITIILLSMLLTACKDEELMLQRIPYKGDELRIDGYYYTQWGTHTTVMFFYRNGITLSAMSYGSLDLNSVEKEMINRYEYIRNEKSGWGVFLITGDTLEAEIWTTSVGGGLPVYKWKAYIENDTTFRKIAGNVVYHFKQFSPKPDSTNQFIK